VAAEAAEKQGPAVPRVAEAYRCRYCGAPLRVGPDTVVAICPYCGRPNWIRGSPRELRGAKTPGPEEAEEYWRRLAEKDPDLRSVSPVLARVESVLVPYYLGRGTARSRYEASGHLVVTITRRRGDKTVTETRLVPFHVSGLYEAGFEALLVARRSPGEEAARLLAEHYLRTRPGLVPLEEAVGEWRRGFHQALAADRSPEEARRWFLDDACDRVRKRVREVIRERARRSYVGPGTVTAVNVGWERVPCLVEGLEVEGPFFLPLVRAYYVVEDRIYPAFFAGWDGAPLAREEPFTTAQRLALSILGGLAAGLGGSGAAAALAGIGGAVGAAAALLAGGAGAVLGFLLSRAALLPARRERGGPGGWLRSVDEAFEEAMGRVEGKV
jgi:predicted RNA-binding Zn-ribbon protein involved in translation (DUF1610 family)